MTLWCMCISCWMPNATNTHSEYVILIAFTLHQVHERASLLRYTTLSVLLWFLCGGLVVVRS